MPKPDGEGKSDASQTRFHDTSFEARASRLDWHDLKLFLDVAEAGSLRAGSVRTGHAINTLRIHLDRIEDLLGAPVARRSPKGLKLTKAGSELLRIGRRMRLLNGNTSNRPTGPRRPATNVRIAVTEGLGTFWLMPRMVEFQKANPDLRLTLNCDMQRVDLDSGDFDLAVQLDNPADDEKLTTLRLGTLHVMPFASETYLRHAGVPQSVDDWPKHKLVWQEADQVASDLLPYFVGTSEPNGLIGITTNNSSAHFRAVSAGAGIGFLPTYARAISKRVRPLDIGVQLRREIYCISPTARARSPAVRKAITWLRNAFCPDIYPWFSDTFLHPNEFQRFFSDAVVVSLFEGFIDNIDDDGV
ncbi:LysR family transcriptional regulator [Sphingomonas panacis]|uniref:LysR family transcriptional regulator n=1 Tax=Sphingomonas panacis TaxID=1560345 RepID=A0A1B3ZE01_9SPHN|nr:LysR family transcriptional regulator [Sphingomonas panacis]AOH85649.1 LysR family transcriptional regulator [Sphingomonas panacis]